jgi:23S rRNA (adenine2503-C2)-methyltransferase
MSTKKDIRALSEAQIVEILKEKGEPKFRAKQIYEWLWKKSCTSFAGMKNISAETRAWLAENFVSDLLRLFRVEIAD